MRVAFFGGKMNKKLVRQILLVVIGQSILGLGVSIFLYVNLGIDTVGVLHTGVANLFKISFGLALFLESLLVIFIIYLIDKSYIHIATLISLFGVSVTSEIYLKILPYVFPVTIPYIFRILILLLACLILAIGLNVYVLADLGIGPIDAIPEIISDKFNIEYKYVKVAFDLTCLVVGYLIGGVVGVGTLISAFVVGPMIQFVRNAIKEPINNFINIV